MIAITMRSSINVKQFNIDLAFGIVDDLFFMIKTFLLF